ncbi:MAG: mechanosensitive ion channel family protein [Alphaproteobacteria bacterium]
MDSILHILDLQFFSNSILNWGLAAITASVSFLGLLTLRGFLRRRYTRDGVQRRPAILARQIGRWFIFIVALYAATYFLVLPPKLVRLATLLLVVALLVEAGLLASFVLGIWTENWRRKFTGDQAARTTAMTVGSVLGRTAIWAIVVMLVMDNLGIKVTAVMAGLGIGGIAVALAAQNILGDLFASLAIIFDKPFQVGDFIVVGEALGTVERIGIKTTRLRSLSGEQIVLGNTELLKGRIHNFKRMHERRIEFVVRIAYDTDPEKLTALPPAIKAIVEAQPRTRFDRAHFKSFGDYGLIFEVAYYVLHTDYNFYMDTQQAINLGIMRYVTAQRLEFALTYKWTRDGGPGGASKAIGDKPNDVPENIPGKTT